MANEIFDKVLAIGKIDEEWSVEEQTDDQIIFRGAFGHAAVSSDGKVTSKVTKYVEMLEAAIRGDELPVKPKAARSQENKAIVPNGVRKSQGEALVKPRAINTLSRDEIRKFTKCQDANDDEVDYFVEVCWRRGLNIFAGDAYLVKYGGKNPAASIIVSKEAFMKKAEQNPNFDGMDSGIILQIGDEIREIDGTFYMGNKSQIVGAWAKVYRKDRSHPSVAKVAFSEFKGQSHFWEGKPAVMINKVAEMTALRKAFPSDLGALYGAEECNVDLGIDPEKEVPSQ